MLLKTYALIASTLLLATGCGSSTGGDHPTSANGPVSSAPGQTQPTTGTLPDGVLASIPMPEGPLGVTAAFDSIWVESHRSNELVRIDPQANRVMARIDVGGNECGLPAAGYGRIWVATCEMTGMVVVDPTTNQVVGSLPDALGLNVAMAGGSVWTASGEHTIARIDPQTLRPQASITVGGAPDHLTFGAGSIWTANSADGTVSRVDPASNQVVATVAAGSPTGDGEDMFVTFDLGFVWVNSTDPSVSTMVWRIDPADNSVRKFNLQLPAGANATASSTNLATGAGSVWLRLRDQPVYRFDAQTLAPMGTYPADPWTDGYTALGFGSLWVTNVQPNTLWRVRI